MVNEDGRVGRSVRRQKIWSIVKSSDFSRRRPTDGSNSSESVRACGDPLEPSTNVSSLLFNFVGNVSGGRKRRSGRWRRSCTRKNTAYPRRCRRWRRPPSLGSGGWWYEHKHNLNRNASQSGKTNLLIVTDVLFMYVHLGRRRVQDD